MTHDDGLPQTYTFPQCSHDITNCIGQYVYNRVKQDAAMYYVVL